ncbi:MAG: hypothetical protein CXZ00_00130 [Acidobacteria bacterium]|nr:MAG: hypothetical protein CXZ00_00130 [Acidobacteriota bacterium]
MTLHERVTIEPSDICGIEYCCEACGAEILVSIASATQRITVCPVCHDRWIVSDPSAEINAVLEFIGSLETIRETKLNKFKIRLRVSDSLGGVRASRDKD